MAALDERGERPVLIHTGQHFDRALSEVFFDRLGLPEPDHQLGVGAATRGEQFGEITVALARLLPKIGVAETIVVGDVTSTAAAAVAADSSDLVVTHVEAGLRSFDDTMPEERNRKIVDALATRLLVSEPAGVANLRREGVPDNRIYLVGNVMIDTLFRFRDLAAAAKPWDRRGLIQGGYALATLHRPSNVDAAEPLTSCLAILAEVARRWPVLFAVHPRTQARLGELKIKIPDGVVVTGPLDYVEFIGLMQGARVVLTDSGGAQEETTALRVPCLTLRENTERPVTVNAGSSRLVGRDLAMVSRYLEEIAAGTFAVGNGIPLWDGHAGSRIADILLRRDGAH